MTIDEAGFVAPRVSARVVLLDQAGSVLLLRNAGDPSIDHDFNEALVRRLVPPDRVQIYQVPAEAHLPHDYVCPDPEFGPDTQIVEGYHQLQQALGIPMPDPLATR